MTDVVLVDGETGEVIEAEVLPEGASPPELARIANDAHKRCRDAFGASVVHAVRSGEALLAAKSYLSHGEFGPWLESECPDIAPRTARKYMRLAKRPCEAVLEAESINKALDAISTSADGNASQVTNNSGDNEWFTPGEYIEAARRVMGGIDLDPASNAVANEVVRAGHFYSRSDNGLVQPWFGRVWMNPPYRKGTENDSVYPFALRMADAVSNGEVDQAVVLVNSATDTAWFHVMGEVASAVCHVRKRIRFWHPDKPEADTPLQGQTFFYFGTAVEAFRTEFLTFGWVLEPSR